MRENMGLFRGKRKGNGEWITGIYDPENKAIISVIGNIHDNKDLLKGEQKNELD